jgi:catechol 2,3-dioxygenase-like lactoylglutathione lyase family enzyme
VESPGNNRAVNIHHINFGCRESDLPKIEEFYGRLFGFKIGYRPPFASRGIWLYDGDHPLIHVVVRFPEDWAGIDHSRCGYDHTAYWVSNVNEYRRRFKEMGVPYEEQNVKNAGYQLFAVDPVGNKIELNFPPGESVEDGVPEGTMSVSQFPDQAKAKAAA